MTTKRVRLYFHSDKSSNAELIPAVGLETEEAKSNFLHLGYEIDLLFDVDLKTGEGKLIGCDGRFLGDENYSDGEVEVSA